MQQLKSKNTPSPFQGSQGKFLRWLKEKGRLVHRNPRERVELPFEILGEVMENLYNDPRTLLAAALVSKHTLESSRRVLFSTVVFRNGNDRDFDTFLGLLDSPWTSLSCIRRIHLHSLAKPTRPYVYEMNRNLDRIFSHLANVRSLWLTSMTWEETVRIPSPIIRLVKSLDITDIQLDRMTFTTSTRMRSLLVSLPRTIETISLYNAQDVDMEFDEANDQILPSDASIYERPWCFQTLDSYTIIRFSRMWEPFLSQNTNLRVETLYLQLSDLAYPDRQTYLPFMSNFIKLFSPSLKAISLNLRFGLTERDPSHAFEALDFCQCNNIDRVHIGLVEPQTRDEIPFWVNLIWKLLAPILSASSPTHVIFTVQLGEEQPQAVALDRLLMFPWADIITRLYKEVQSLKKVILRIGSHYPAANHVYIDKLRGTELKKFEEAGSLGFQEYEWKIPNDSMVTSWPVHWRDAIKVDG